MSIHGTAADWLREFGRGDLGGTRLLASERRLALAVAEVARQHPDHSRDQAEARARARLICMQAPPPEAVPRASAPAAGGRPAAADGRGSRLALWAWRVAILVLLLILAARARAQNCGICVVKIQQAGAAVGTAAAPFTLDFGTNLAVSKTGSTYVLSASSTAATAWSAITAASNANAGTFSMSGNTLDLSGAAALRAPVAANCATAETGELCFDATNSTWHFYSGSADAAAGVVAGSGISLAGAWPNQTISLGYGVGSAANDLLQVGSGGTIPGSVVPLLNQSTSGNAATATQLAATPSQCPSTQVQTGIQANGDANCQDPLVSGPTAAGSAPAAGSNPVLVGGLDGTDVRTLLTDSGGRLVINVNSLPALPSGSNPIGGVSQTGTWTVTATPPAETSIAPRYVTSAATLDASPGTLDGYQFSDSGSAACYIEFFDAASGGVTLGTTAPIAVVALFPTASNQYVVNSSPGFHLAFSTALSAAAVTAYNGATTCPASTALLDSAMHR